MYLQWLMQSIAILQSSTAVLKSKWRIKFWKGFYFGSKRNLSKNTFVMYPTILSMKYFKKYYLIFFSTREMLPNQCVFHAIYVSWKYINRALFGWQVLMRWERTSHLANYFMMVQYLAVIYYYVLYYSIEKLCSNHK